MIYPEYLEKEVLLYCQRANIAIIKGVIPSRYVEEVQMFIRVLAKSDRNRTREFEETNKFKINPLAQVKEAKLIESPIEEFMLQAISQHGLATHCRPQFQIGTKRVDIAFPIAKLVVECDGREYHFLEEEQIEKDQKRDMYLAKQGWVVKHFDGLIIRRNIEICINEIRDYLNPFLGIAKTCGVLK